MSNKATVFAVDLLTTNDYLPQTASRQIERGGLVSMVLIPKGANIRHGELYAKVEILTGGSQDEHSAAVLIEDYITQQAPAYWNGLYILAQQTIIRLTTWSIVVRTIRLTGTINIQE